MKHPLSLLLNEDEPLIHLSLILGIPAWFFLVLAFFSKFSGSVVFLILSFVMAVMGSLTGILSFSKCKRKGLAWFVTGLNGSLVGFLVLSAAWVISRLSDLH